LGCQVSGVRRGGEAIAEFDHAEREPNHFAEEEWLGHGGGLQVEQIGIKCEEGKRDGGWRRREPDAGEAIEAEAREEPCQGRGDDTGDAVGPPTVDLYERDHEDVGQWKPDGAKLREAGDAGVEDAACNVEVSNRVAVVEEGVVMPAPGDGEERERRAGGQGEEGFAARDGACRHQAQSRWVRRRK
jgi:hypothetical protein